MYFICSQECTPYQGVSILHSIQKCSVATMEYNLDTSLLEFHGSLQKKLTRRLTQTQIFLNAVEFLNKKYSFY